MKTKMKQRKYIFQYGYFLIALLFAPYSMAQTIPPAEIVMSEDMRVENPLTTAPADPFNGLSVFIDRKLGNCVACHSNFDVAAMQFLGEIGPNLDWIGDYYTDAELRAILVDSKLVFGEQTIMPAFYSTRTGARTLSQFQGKTILTAQQIEDLVAYLSSLRRADVYDGAD